MIPSAYTGIQEAIPRGGNARRRSRRGGEQGVRVVILHDRVPADAPPDQQDTLDQVREVEMALEGLGYRVTTLALDLNLTDASRRLRAMKPVAVFNLAESVGGDGSLAHLPAQWLESLQVPFTGCSGEALFLTTRKPLAKRLLRGAGLPTPDWYPEVETNNTQVDDADDCTWLVKSVCEEASIGLNTGALVEGIAAARERISDCTRRHGGEWFAERYIEGREFNVGLLANLSDPGGGPAVLPIAEMEFVDFPANMPRIVDYAAKWDADSFGYSHTRRRFDLPPADADLRETLAAMSRSCWKLFGLRGYARVDFRVDAAGRPWILEINANPCIAAHAGFTAAAARIGLDLNAIVARLLTAAVHA
jgi:D-alanine-D-alanine ligase